ncbi:MAG TPA: hypothetical protein VFH37_01540 [Candidatus Saccharimonadales bacterium]|nr:hypothetical protein [Candidatus Saccharimonadales bacterium]
MTGLNHAVTGALVAAVIDKPILALPAALLSHFAADAIPHWNYELKPHIARRQVVILADLVLSLALLLILALTVDARPWLIIGGGLLAILPDTMWLRFFITGRPAIHGSPKRFINRLRKFHFWIQWSETSRGLFIETLWFPLMLLLIYQTHQ